ncbi:MAG TPA: type II toxin-antitoxin system VapC family toxin, partial [Gemmatimonadaceae bacterium]|nr:type II toxin-antitoxin system VapC family toxin [Gemmatimonadaceae bacterium]
MTVHLDTSALVDALTGPRRSLDVLIELAEQGHRLSVCAVVLYEWLRGPRTQQELVAQEDLFPRTGVIPFGAEQAALAAKLYARLKRPGGREIDLAIAACALHDNAALWTLNRAD